MACACNFTIAGVASHDNGATDGGSPPGITPMPDLTPLPDKVGDACAGSCGAGLTCMSWVPDGYCSESCDSASDVCPPGSTCVDTGSGSRYCLVNANGGGKCTRPDLSCRDCGSSVCGPSSFCDGC
jgi:hypothetical protein